MNEEKSRLDRFADGVENFFHNVEALINTPFVATALYVGWCTWAFIIVFG